MVRWRPRSGASETDHGNSVGFGAWRSVADGRIVVTGAQSGALTFFAPDLTPRSMLLVENHVPGTVLPIGPDIVFGGIGRDMYAADMDGLYHRLADSTVTWSSWNTLAASKPYWNGLGRVHAAVGGDSVYVMAGLLHPATILNGAGDSVGTIGTPSAGFRRVPELEPGALAFTSAEGMGAQAGNPIKRLIESFDLVTSMDIVDGDRRVFTVGRLDPAKPWFPFDQLDVSVEAYDRHTGHKLFEDVRLPEGSKLLGGGRYLYVLLGPRMPPWRIAKYALHPM